MNKESNEKIRVILERILGGYSLGKNYNYCLEYSVEGLLKDVRMNDSEIDLILKHLEERKIIDNFRDSGNDNVIAEPTYTIYFSEDFREKATAYLSQLSGIPVAELPQSLSLQPKEPEIEIGALVSYSDGSIAYSNQNLAIRGQLKVLLRLFMENVGRLVLLDDIKDSIINTDKRGATSNETISKYISELRKILKASYRKEVIFNQKKEGWIFSPDRDLNS